MYQWKILQEGSLPLLPSGRTADVEHVCTVTLIWPADSELSAENSVVVDPCFSLTGMQTALGRLKELRADTNQIGHYFQSHLHFDHVLNTPSLLLKEPPVWSLFPVEKTEAFAEIKVVPCPGHAEDLRALRCPTPAGELWVASDATSTKRKRVDSAGLVAHPLACASCLYVRPDARHHCVTRWHPLD